MFFLKDNIKSKIPYNDFLRLHEILGISKTKVSRNLNNPGQMHLDTVIKLATLLNIHPAKLIVEMGAGQDTISVHELKSLVGCRLNIEIPE